MKRNKIIIMILLLVLTINVYLMYKILNNRGSPIEDLILKEEINDLDNFAIMIEQSDGTYIESSDTKFPKDYKINIEKSKCIDKDGNVLKNILTNINNVIQVRTTTTSYCYLYFDIGKIDVEKLKNHKDIWKSTLEDDGYRFVGTNPDNYICFGTTSQSDCTGNTDLYMYRIIGIFEDSEGQQHLKLIKKEALNTSYAWNTDNQTDIAWNASDLYNGINGSYFLTNTAYSYMQDTSWTNKIATWDYTATNTKILENYIANGVYGPSYATTPVSSIYLHEMNRSGKSSATCYYGASTTADCNAGLWDIVSAKIGLMYVSDYQLSLGSKALDYTNAHYQSMKTGWMHISNNDSVESSQYEWSMSRFGIGTRDYYNAWSTDSDGKVLHGNVANDGYSVRPVFYLKYNVIIESGAGSSNDPYIIQQATTDTEKLIENASSDDLWASTLEDDGYRYVGTDPSNYVCFGYSDSSTDCDFTNTTNTDLYAYRIIGIFEDSEGNQQLKLIKKEALNTNYTWHNNQYSDFDWDESGLYKGINDSYFLTNTDYSYMQDSTWKNKIATWDYTATNTLTYENSGPNYRYDSVQNIYLHELGRSTRTNTIGEWKTVSAKIGLMYVSDYLLSLGENVLNYTNNSHYASMKTGWMHITNNDNGIPIISDFEWTMTRNGNLNGEYLAWYVDLDGYVGSISSNPNSAPIRPVFYLTTDVIIIGEGTISKPYIIS